MQSSSLESITNEIKRFQQRQVKMMEAKKNWDLKNYKKIQNDFYEAFQKINEAWPSLEKDEEAWLFEIEKNLKDSDYIQKIESLLKDKKIPFSGKFPDYSIAPFKLSFDISKNHVKLSMGKEKRETFTSLKPDILIELVAQEYRTTWSRNFNEEQFYKELKSAYEYLSGSNWKRELSIKKIYELLTIKESTKKVYSESDFIFDLARLLKEYDPKYESYRFEFTAHKDGQNNYTIVDSEGREKQIGLLSIYPIDSN